MPPQQDNLQYIQIKDFRPGISDNPGANYPPGAAQRDLTYKCIANRAGALVPLPDSQGISGIPPHEASVAAIVGLYLPPIQVTSTDAPEARFPPHEILVGSEIVFSGQRFHRLRRYRRSPAGNPVDTLESRVAADATAPAPTPGGFNPNGMSFGTVRSHRSDPLNPGVPVVIARWSAGPTFGYVAEFPDDLTTGSSTPFHIFDDNAWIVGVTCHQGRVVMERLVAYNHGPNSQAIMGENLLWTAVNDVTVANLSTPDQVFVPENPSGYSFLFSMTANELFGVKQASGGVYASGDLNTPTVVTLPLVTGSDLQQTPTSSDIGLIYGSRSSGVWVWSHGDTSSLISPQMEPLFWTLEEPASGTSGQDDFGNVAYQFARSDDWVLCPNNFLYDTTLKSWWRLENPIGGLQYRFMAANFRFIYGAVSWFGNPAPGILSNPIFFYDRNNLASDISWQSHPQWETIDTLVDIREIVLRVKGHGSVTVELRGESTNPNVPPSVTVSFNTTVPVMIRTPFRIQDSNIAVRIRSFATAGADPFDAPTVYECNLGYYPAQKEMTS